MPRPARAFGEEGAFNPRVLLTGTARWELELESLRKVVRIRPLFTFQAVPAASAQP